MRRDHRRKPTTRSTVKTNPAYTSNCYDKILRGNAHQIVEKYETLAAEADAMGDRTLAENYRQHAEHYIRIIAGEG